MVVVSCNDIECISVSLLQSGDLFRCTLYLDRSLPVKSIVRLIKVVSIREFHLGPDQGDAALACDIYLQLRRARFEGANYRNCTCDIFSASQSCADRGPAYSCSCDLALAADLCHFLIVRIPADRTSAKLLLRL